MKKKLKKTNAVSKNRGLRMNSLEKLLGFCVKHPWFGLFLFLGSWAIGSLIIDIIRTVFGVCKHGGVG